jgi:hypothetical protein
MRLIKPNSLAGPKGNKSPARPDWYAEWLSNQGKYVLLECGCIEDVHMPQCVTLLTGKKIYIACPFDLDHSFQLIKRTLTYREALMARGISFTDTPELPPF